MAHPRAWRRYVGLLGKGKSPEVGLARFSARFHLATCFAGVMLRDLSERATAAYSAGIRVALSYSALEALDSALGKRIARAQLSDRALAARYRSQACDSLRSLLEESSQSMQLQGQLEALALGSEVDDVMPVAAAVRHLVFHGDFTAHGSGAAQSAHVRRFLDDLADALLARADDQFELYLDREAIGPWDVRRRQTCPSCGVAIGKRHGSACEIAVCKNHGERRSECFGEGRHGATTYWGVYPGTIEALKRGWVVSHGGREVPDINRVIVELTWEPASEQYV